MGPLRRASLARLPLATVALIALNVLAYLLAIRHGGSVVGGPTNQVIVGYGAIPYELTHSGRHCGLSPLAGSVLCTGQPGVVGRVASQPPTWETVFTSLFLHANVLGIAAAVILVGRCGRTVEEAVGGPGILLLYVLGGLGALLVAVGAWPGSAAPTLAAAGAVGAVVGGCLALRPRPAVAALALAWLALDGLLAGLGAFGPLRGGSAADHYAPLAGVAVGLLAIAALAGRRAYVEARTA